MEKRIEKKFKAKSFSDGPGKASKTLGLSVTHSGENLSGKTIWIEDRDIHLNTKITHKDLESA